MEEDIDYYGLIRRAKQVADRTQEIEDDLLRNVAGFLEPEGHPRFPRYIGEKVGEEELHEVSEDAAEQLNSLYYVKIQTRDLSKNLDAGRSYTLDGRTVRGTSLKRKLGDIHRRILKEEETILELVEDVEKYTPAEPLQTSYNDYGWEDLSNPD